MVSGLWWWAVRVPSLFCFLSLHNNSEAARCPDYWSISLLIRHWRDSPVQLRLGISDLAISYTYMYACYRKLSRIANCFEAINGDILTCQISLICLDMGGDQDQSPGEGSLSRCTQNVSTCQHITEIGEIQGNKIVREFDSLFNLYLDRYKVWHMLHSG